MPVGRRHVLHGSPDRSTTTSLHTPTRTTHLHKLLGVRGGDVHRALVALHGGRLVACGPERARTRTVLVALLLPAPLLAQLVGQAAAVEHHKGLDPPRQQQLHAGHAVGDVFFGRLALHQLTRAGVGTAVQQAIRVHRDWWVGGPDRSSARERRRQAEAAPAAAAAAPPQPASPVWPA